MMSCWCCGGGWSVIAVHCTVINSPMWAVDMKVAFLCCCCVYSALGCPPRGIPLPLVSSLLCVCFGFCELFVHCVWLVAVVVWLFVIVCQFLCCLRGLLLVCWCCLWFLFVVSVCVAWYVSVCSCCVVVCACCAFELHCIMKSVCARSYFVEIFCC